MALINAMGRFVNGSMNGSDNTFYGKKHSNKTKAKMRAAWKKRLDNGWTMSPEQREKRSKKLKGRVMSDKTRKKMIIALKEGRTGHVFSKFWSKKNHTWVHCRSSYEKAAYRLLEAMRMVVSYEVEPFTIPYRNGYDDIRNYLPDVLITYRDGSQELVEIKPERIVCSGDEKFRKKSKAAEKFCSNKNISFVIWSEDQIFVHKLREPVRVH